MRSLMKLELLFELVRIYTGLALSLDVRSFHQTSSMSEGSGPSWLWLFVAPALSERYYNRLYLRKYIQSQERLILSRLRLCKSVQLCAA